MKKPPKIIPSHVNFPNVWAEGALFAFSGMDGPTNCTSGFLATYAPQPFGLLFHTPRRRVLDIELPEPGDVLVATNDTYAIETPQGNLVVVFACWHSIVGWIPGDARFTLRFETGEQATHSGLFQISHDQTNHDALALVINDDCFALSYGNTPDQARRRAQAALTFDIPEQLSLRLQAYQSLPDISDPNDSRLLKKCLSVIRANTLAPEGTIRQSWSTPHRIDVKDMHTYDSVFHCLALNHLNSDLAWQSLRSLLDTQQPDGMIPHHSSPIGLDSPITHPPLLAWAAWQNYRFTANRTHLHHVFTALERYLQWDLDHRDTNADHLLAWSTETDSHNRHIESTQDNSPRFDQPIPPDAVDFSALAAHDMHHLALIADELSLPGPAEHWRQNASEMSNRIHQLLWNPETTFYHDRCPDGTFSPIRAASGFLPLLLADCPPDRIDALINLMEDTDHFNAPFPIPSIALSEASWSTDLWRGPTWLSTNYLIVIALRRHNHNETASRLVRKTIDNVNRHYQQLGVLFEFYDSSDHTPPPACHRLGPCDEPYQSRTKTHCIRDHNTTAAVTAALLLDTQTHTQ